MKRLFIVFIALLHVTASFAGIIGEEVKYRSGDQTFIGFLAYNDEMKDKRPGVLVVHEWWGHNDYVRRRARMLAEIGYTAFAVDMYGDGKVAEHPDDARSFTQQATKSTDITKNRFLAALEVVRNHRTVDAGRIAAIGYCFGGSTVLNMARMGVDIDGVVSFHGSLSTKTPAAPGVVTAEVLVCHGADDKFISEEQIEQFKNEMKNAGVSFDFRSYPGALHGFTNPDADALAKKFGLTIAYHADADKQSWQDMREFFNRIFKK